MSQSLALPGGITTRPQALLAKAPVVAIALAVSVVLVLTYRIIYNAFFHPLAKYPGPWLSRVTNLYSAYHAWKGDIHTDILRCHQIYGDRVRYAPNRVLVNTAEALRDIYGHGAHVRKFAGYRVLSSQAVNTLTMTDKTLHARRRRVINQAFSERSLRLFESVIQSKIESFCQVLRGASSEKLGIKGQWTQPRDMAHQFTRLTFDLMTTLSFGADYHTISSPDFRYVVPAIEASNVRLSVLWQAPELTWAQLDRRILLRRSAAAARTFVQFLRLLLKSRLQKKPEADGEDDTGKGDNDGVRDIFSFLERCTDPDSGKGMSPRELSTETATFVVAGTDTSSTAMAALAHYLAGSPRCYRRAAAEVRAAFNCSSVCSPSVIEEIRLGPKLNECVFLRACLDEALRLSPPGGGPLWREVEAEGAVVAGDFIPAGCEVGAGIYAMQRSSKNWEDPDQYRPERWLEDKDKDRATRPAYFPFNIGPRSCVGKPLALAQIMLTMARVFCEFDFRLADSEYIPGDINDEDVEPTPYVLKDHVTGQKQGPLLCFRPRV